MFRDFFELHEKQFNLNSSKAEVRDAIAICRSTLRKIERLEEIDSADLLIPNIFEFLQNTLYQEAYNAFKINNEFDIPEYVSRLNQAIFNPQTYEITKLSAESISIKINLDKTAGTLDDYARAVSKVRKQLEDSKGNKKPKKRNPTWASHAWAEKFYGPAREGKSIPDRVVTRIDKKTGKKITRIKSTPDPSKYIEKYWKTINARISNFSTLAPFWKILDQGTIKLKSDIGGKAYPINQKTNFVAKTISAGYVEFRKQLSKLIVDKKIAIELKSIVYKKYEELVGLLEIIEKITGGSGGGTGVPGIGGEPIIDREVIVKLIHDQVEKTNPNIDADNFIKLRNRIINDIEAGRQPRARYYSQTGGVRASIRTTQIMKTLGI